ncbi:uncharacterized protein M421DRAFT_24152, partial [Didymella exigua CBS 183.55]
VRNHIHMATNVSSTPLPKRLLDIEAGHKVRLCLNNENEHGVYLCLSHHWGGVVPLQLTSSMIGSFKEAVPWADVPLNPHEAIDTAVRLGHHFICIFSLCILQDNLNAW